MSSILVELSVGRMADRLARAVGWSPVGHWLRIKDAEGPEASRLAGRLARVTSMDGRDLIVEILPAHDGASDAMLNLRLSPRHQGWTAYSLMLVAIATVVSRSRPVDGGGPIAIATAKLERSKLRRS